VTALFDGSASRRESQSRNGRVVFLGDSITELGGKPDGNVTLVSKALSEKHGANAPEVINAGISGNKITDLQKRLERDVLSKNPNVVVIYIGINDVWHFALPGSSGTAKRDFESGLHDVVVRCRAAGARVILCTPSVIGEMAHGENPQDELLDEYSNISREVAIDTKSQLCDLNRSFIDYLRTHNQDDRSEGILTVDGVHLTKEGNQFIAGEMLKALGY